MVIGGQAVIEHGEPRFTADVDLTLCLPPYELRRLLPVLSRLGLRPKPPDPQDHVDRTHVLPSFSPDSRLRVDMSFTDSEYETQAIQHGVDIEIEGVPVRFTSAEDLVIHKLIAWRGVDQQDVRGVLLKNPDIDADYILHWARLFEEVLDLPIVERFEGAWREAGL
jgi:Nucleotidyl transferase AbiEii toxin, Type IV TA system